MAIQIGKGQIFGTSGTIDILATIIKDSVRATASTDKDRIKGNTGEVESVIYSGKVIEITIEFIPSAATTTLALVQATIPADGTKVGLSAFPVISIYGIADVFNSTDDWVSEGGSINLSKDGKATGTLNLARYPSITDVTAIA